MLFKSQLFARGASDFIARQLQKAEPKKDSAARKLLLKWRNVFCSVLPHIDQLASVKCEVSGLDRLES